MLGYCDHAQTLNKESGPRYSKAHVATIETRCRVFVYYVGFGTEAHIFGVPVDGFARPRADCIWGQRHAGVLVAVEYAANAGGA